MAKDNIDIDSKWHDSDRPISIRQNNEKILNTLDYNMDKEQKQINQDKEKSIQDIGKYVQKLGYIVQNLSNNLQKLSIDLRTYTDAKGAEAIPNGYVETKRYRNYYDVSHTITTATADNPNDFDSPVYQRERIFIDLQRFAEKVMVTNEGPGTLYIIVSHGGEVEFSQETPIFAGDTKWYYNVYELRTRSPVAGLTYRVTEYDIHTSGSTGFIPLAISTATLQNVPLPAANTNWLTSDITPTNTPTTFRIQVAVSIAGNFSVAITNSGDTQVVTLNAPTGPALIAGGNYIFEVLVHSGDSINFRYSTTGGTIQILRVQEIDAAVA
jgi:hypothetical protein